MIVLGFVPFAILMTPGAGLPVALFAAFTGAAVALGV